MSTQADLFSSEEQTGKSPRCGQCGEPMPHARASSPGICKPCEEDSPAGDVLQEAREAVEPPYIEPSATSREAARRIKDRASTLRSQVLAYLLYENSRGATDEEIQDALGMRPSTERPRRVELVRMGLVEDSGRTRDTDSGRPATVWEAKA